MKGGDCKASGHEIAREHGVTVWFTADTHFGHGAARGRFRRPFRTTSEMDETLIVRWNECVRADDVVWHLGDFAYRMTGDAMRAVLQRLNGTKHLVTGNNDGAETTALPGWASVQAYVELELEGVRLVLCHYPFRTWNGMYKGALNLHGHSHGQLAGLTRQVDVGVDVWDYRPVTLAAIRTRRSRRHEP
jgi:calcineurin-like phosphoesterase family protein